ncbi:phosphate ABC transporter permease PtsA [Clostridium sp. TF06-15AC]|mgnify:FL=1|jgi:phosphate transport system permease protein|uniref:Phosphate transport system permease protein PstA n=1 Tax=Clostridium segne TaxID=2763038 RepID=A0AAW3WZF8_9CLOT|nr:MULTISPECIES: phosphate ABC transporter permease PstA [Clostridium]MBC5655786.1 phosphate ABC transporter permease PstA [Clostridium segne]RHQ26767.1 phosphate ABC transporter permease PtsA [Clostridium sp. AF27-5AA]RHU73444.1 phosphate ABC transporter permease PtsA [Clostridium sp. TF06-15AC]
MTDNRMKSICQKRTRIGDNILKVLIYLAAGVAIALLVGIMGYVFVRGLPQVSWQLLSTVQSSLKGTFGILGNIINTIYIIVITLIIAAPIGIGSAIYLNEYAKPGKLVRTIEFTTEILSGIPSIIFGLFGMVFFGMTLKLGYSVLTGSFTLTLMVLPLITRNTQEALKTVPDSYRSGALGIGATKWYMIRTILLPSAAPGILTGVILSIGRIVGESAALLFTAGSGFQLPKNLFGKLFESSGTLTIQLYLSMQKAKYDQAFGIAVVLLIIVLGINLLTRFLTNRFDVTKLK